MTIVAHCILHLLEGFVCQACVSPKYWNFRELSRRIGTVTTTRQHTSDRTKDAIKRLRWVVLPHRSHGADISEVLPVRALQTPTMGADEKALWKETASRRKGSSEILAYQGLQYPRFALFWDFTLRRVLVS